MMKYLLASCACIALVACQPNSGSDTSNSTQSSQEQKFSLPDGVQQVESVTKAGDEIVIPYKKFVLDNGLTVVLHEDKSDPLVHVDVTYHVGSGREEVGRSGFAHFFEHMMFQGSENVADEEHFRVITEAGGTLNGTTNSDRTNYFQTIPKNQLEKILWLEADRMGYFLNAVTQEKFEVQRETVKNERGQRVDNQPYGLLWERVGEAMYPEGHPYSWSTIGYLVDLDRADLSDLKRFFLRWYGPNNATLTIGGDIDAEETLEWVKKYFAPIPEGPAVEDPVYTPVSLDQDRYISLEDNVAIPLIYMAWPTVNAYHPDEAPLDVLMSILGEGKTSLLYKNLEKDGLAVQTGAGHGCRELSCQFTLLALPNPQRGQTLADIEAVLRGSLEEFEDRGVQDDDLTRVKAGIVSGMIYGLESVSGKVSQLAAYETFRDNPNGISQDIARYENVTKDDVMRVYETYIKDKPAVIMSIVPQGQTGLIAAEDTWDRYERTIPERAPEEDVDWSLPVDDFDRSVVPPAGENPAITVPPVYDTKLSNGIEVLGAVNSETPTTTINIRMRVGQSHETTDQLGLASLTASMLDETTTDSSVEELSNALDKLGSSVSISSGDTFTTLSIRTLTRNLDETIAIAAEKLFQPAFLDEDFARVQANTVQSIEASKKQPSGIATELFLRRLYGDDNPFAYSGLGTTETVSNLTLDQVRDFYNTHYSASVASIVVVSDLEQKDIVSAMAPFTDWEATDVPEPVTAAFPDNSEAVLYLVDRPNSAQSEIRVGKRSLPYDATGEYYKATLMNYPLGGAFNSRINLNLREDKGYTYGARAFFSGETDDRGHYRVQTAVRSDVTGPSLVEIINEVTNYHQSGITPVELEFTKSAVGQRDARAYETPRQKLGFLGRMMTYDLSPSFVDEQADILAGLTESEVNGLAQTHLNPDDMLVLVVGDKSVIGEDLEALGYPIVDLNEDGSLKSD